MHVIGKPRRPVNLTLDSDLVSQGKALGLNLSRIAEEAIAAAIRQAQAEAWSRENAEAIDAYNRRVERTGVFSDGLRSF
jgi:antitoxin CcdA